MQIGPAFLEVWSFPHSDKPRHIQVTLDVKTTHTVGHIPLTCTGFDQGDVQ